MTQHDTPRQERMTLNGYQESASCYWDHRYRILLEGEIIQEGDECLTDSHLGWQKGIHCVGQPAPSPYYSSHRMYRRLRESEKQAP